MLSVSRLAVICCLLVVVNVRICQAGLRIITSFLNSLIVHLIHVKQIPTSTFQSWEIIKSPVLPNQWLRYSKINQKQLKIWCIIFYRNWTLPAHFQLQIFILDFAWVALHDSSVRIMLISVICLKQAVLTPLLLSQTKILNSRWAGPLSSRVPCQELTLELVLNSSHFWLINYSINWQIISSLKHEWHLSNSYKRARVAMNVNPSSIRLWYQQTVTSPRPLCVAFWKTSDASKHIRHRTDECENTDIKTCFYDSMNINH